MQWWSDEAFQVLSEQFISDDFLMCIYIYKYVYILMQVHCIRLSANEIASCHFYS